MDHESQKKGFHNMQTFSEAFKLFESGYSVFPVSGKVPQIANWQKYCEVMPTEDEMNEWNEKFPNSGIGFPLGPTNGMIALDFDYDGPHADILEKQLRMILPPTLCEKIGKKGYTAFYRYNGEANRDFKQKIKTDNGEDSVLFFQILSKGRFTVIPPSIHPNTNKSYYYREGMFSLMNIEANELPEITQKMFEQMESMLVGFASTLDQLKTDKVPYGRRHLSILSFGFATHWKHSTALSLASELIIYDEKNHPGHEYFRDPSELKGRTAEVYAIYLAKSIDKTIEQKTNGLKSFEKNKELLDEPKQSFKFVHQRELMAMDSQEAWLIEGWIQEEELCVLFGDPSVGKSFLSIDLAFRIASGTPWFDSKTTKGPVWYLCGEGYSGIKKRVKGWMIHNPGVDPDVLFSERGASILNEEEAHSIGQSIEAGIKAYGRPKLVIIDTLHTFLGGGDENSSADFGKFLRNVQKFIKERLKCAILIVHHAGHGDKKRSRGTSAIRGSVDVEIAMIRGKEGSQMANKRLIQMTKAKDTEEKKKALQLTEVILPGKKDLNGKDATTLVFSELLDVRIFDEDALSNQDGDYVEPMAKTMAIADRVRDDVLKVCKDHTDKLLTQDLIYELVYPVVSEYLSADKKKIVTRAVESLLKRGLLKEMGGVICFVAY